MPAVNGSYTSTDPEHPLHRLTPEQIEEIGTAFQAIHDEIRADLGEADAHYIRSLIEFHRRLAALSRISTTSGMAKASTTSVVMPTTSSRMRRRTLSRPGRACR